ncbi:unnamed protein product [Pieris brassicae]|uniref:Uncharacterized protein n=1 Tax=Pieris brassicae TaxID=7116 RepID=A0A9P0TMJ0_PIEBR|nr:unnamed protein product [Pieris brassicae]
MTTLSEMATVQNPHLAQNQSNMTSKAKEAAERGNVCGKKARDNVVLADLGVRKVTIRETATGARIIEIVQELKVQKRLVNLLRNYAAFGRLILCLNNG